jgi:6-phosphogluconate dehydrogenase
MKAKFGLIGLGVMGENLALNIEEKGFPIAVFNRSTDKVDDFVKRNPGKKIIGTKSPKEFIESLERPRKFVIMVKAGAPVDQTIEAVRPFLEKDDVVIDGGNEFFTNTERRTKALAPDIHFVGMGVSGGEEGARHGPSLMPGGSIHSYKVIEPVVTAIAAKVDGPCVTYIGEGGSGHYVKMVHNGIEYGDMQLIAETYDVLKSVGGLTNSELADVFSEWNTGELDSFLIDITAKIFTKKDDVTGKDLVDVILDRALMKGTGSWTVKESAELLIPIPTIASSVEAREMSAMHALRQKGAEILKGPSPQPVSASEKKEIIADARAALYAAKAVSYAQGFSLLQKAALQYLWRKDDKGGALPLDNAEIARIWKGGCIIRAKFLGRIQEAFKRDPRLDNLLFDPSFKDELSQRQQGWRRTIARAVNTGIAVPTLSASLSYYDSLRRGRMPMNLTQAQRDFFGAHTYERIDKPQGQFFHTEWS